MGITPLPDDPQFEADIARMARETTEMNERENAKRLEAQVLAIKKRREAAADEVKQKWELEALHSSAWRTYVANADAWVCACERLTLAWDEYDRKRVVMDSAIGEARGFAQRPSISTPELAEWSSHPVLQHVRNDSCFLDDSRGQKDLPTYFTVTKDLPQRWMNIVELSTPQSTLSPKQATYIPSAKPPLARFVMPLDDEATTRILVQDIPEPTSPSPTLTFDSDSLSPAIRNFTDSLIPSTLVFQRPSRPSSAKRQKSGSRPSSAGTTRSTTASGLSRPSSAASRS